jgi:hypothetical protein
MPPIAKKELSASQTPHRQTKRTTADDRKSQSAVGDVVEGAVIRATQGSLKWKSTILNIQIQHPTSNTQ